MYQRNLMRFQHKIKRIDDELERMNDSKEEPDYEEMRQLQETKLYIETFLIKKADLEGFKVTRQSVEFKREKSCGQKLFKPLKN